MPTPDANSLSAFTRMVQSALLKRSVEGVTESVLRDAHAEVFGAVEWNALRDSVTAEQTEPLPADRAHRTGGGPLPSKDIWTPPLFPLIELGRHKSITSVKVNAWFAQASDEDMLALCLEGLKGAGTYDEHICANVYPDEGRYTNYENIFDADERAEHQKARTVSHRMLEWMALEAGNLTIEHLFAGMEGAVESGLGSGGWTLSFDEAWVYAWLESHRPPLRRHLLCLQHAVQVEPVVGNPWVWSWQYPDENTRASTTFESRELADNNAVEALRLGVSSRELLEIPAESILFGRCWSIRVCRNTGFGSSSRATLTHRGLAAVWLEISASPSVQATSRGRDKTRL